ncbi:hypothetical protein Poly24_52220 [Rosistilla carotiformis]|uniref:Uncharacterized protein n=1 Tax=Rosistilla carotiformis TaxID=2528017 RepID=A0A518K160_9BACT|nr:hypothetical protein [Rosistilla carotiformis]QDV71485.1 hypothetical protein Poly24_52220 [Rosistilla carotiformis]
MKFSSRGAVGLLSAMLLILVVGIGGAASGPTADDAAIDSTQCTIECNDVGESSGVAASWRHEGILWTHNDSGDSPRLFAMDQQGRHRHEVEISGAKHIDWEDIASYALDGQPQLMIADVGDNARRRKEVVCYRVNEPNLDSKRVEVAQIWRIQYPDGPRDCEAVAVDVRERVILLACKVRNFAAEVYSVPLETGRKDAQVTATRVGTIGMPMITAMDIDPRDGRVVVASYVDAMIFPRKQVAGGGKVDWEATFAQTPTLLRTPWRRQGEAICFDRHDDAVWLTSEKKPAPLIRVAIPR